ncbi:MAG: hypothetical protein ABJE66_36935 [Deltaproteobacteria bacterium]
MRTALAILLLLAAHTAFAGECSVENMTSMVEARAKKAAPPAAESDFHLCLCDPHTIDFLGATNSAKASPIIVRLWKQLHPAADAKPNDTNIQNDWAAWRVSATAALGATGGADARAFLADQITHKIDRGVKRTAITAIHAIDLHLAK